MTAYVFLHTEISFTDWLKHSSVEIYFFKVTFFIYLSWQCLRITVKSLSLQWGMCMWASRKQSKYLFILEREKRILRKENSTVGIPNSFNSEICCVLICNLIFISNIFLLFCAPFAGAEHLEQTVFKFKCMHQSAF